MTTTHGQHGHATTPDAAETPTETPSLDRFFAPLTPPDPAAAPASPAAPAHGVDVAGLSAFLDGLDDATRAAVTVTMTPRQQARLYDAAKGFLPLTLESFVPQGVAPLEQVVHTGKNSIRFFSRFEKIFCRPEPGSDRLWGYNRNPRSIQGVTGPGYFVCYAIEDGEVLIDYCEVPPGKPEAWPPILPNSAGFSRFIYNRTKDTMRGVSRHVTIGRAARDGKLMANWFVLCRRDAT
jgi:hypothetical protein